jgi:hypothetical protein
MVEQREPSHPPSDPRQPPLGGRASRISPDDFAAEDRPARVRLAGALLLGLVLVASGLYLWRRPSSPSETGSDLAAASASAFASDDASAVPDASDVRAPPPVVVLSDARVLGCHDRGLGTTPADECDHLVPMEKALSHVIEHAGTCVPATGSGGTIEYVADVSFSKRRVRITLPRSGRSVHDRKVIGACAAAVREGMQATSFDGVDHRHARYSIAVTATYRGKNAAGSGLN